MRAFLALFFLMLSGCAHQRFESGLIEASVNHSEVVLRGMSGELIPLVGPLADELSTLPGAMVRLQGVEKGRGQKTRLEVGSYELLDVGDGVPPHVGLLRFDGSRLYLQEDRTGTLLLLAGLLSQEMRALVGSRVWVQGLIVASDCLEVERFGLLKRAP